MRRKIFYIFLASFLFQTTSLAQQQNVSGQVKGPKGTIAHVSVREVDANHRVYNNTLTDENGLFSFKVRDTKHSLQFVANGYHTLTHKMLGANSFTVTLDTLRTIAGINRTHIIYKSKKLLSGRNKGEEIKLKTWVEQIQDTLFALIVPVQVKLPIAEYAAGRNLYILNQEEQIIAQSENAVTVYARDEGPDEISETVITKSKDGSNYIPASIENKDIYYCYPRFLFSLNELNQLIDSAEDISRVLVDTYQANNYWNFYPTASTKEELLKVLKTITKKNEKKKI